MKKPSDRRDHMEEINMSAAPACSEALPEVRLEDDLVEEIPAAFRPVILRVRGELSSDLQPLVVQQPCFGHLWVDPDDGRCPESTTCDLATACKAVYNEVLHNEIKRPRKPQKRKAPNRGKYKGTSKYQRHGYFNMGRPVDKMVAVLVSDLGDPPVLPKNWVRAHFAEYEKQGKLLSSTTTSYHSFLVDGVTVCRFWTNAAGGALVDLSSTLADAAKEAGFDLQEVTPKSKKKLAPCTHRMFCGDVEDAKTLAKLIKTTYKLRKKRSKK